MSARSASKNNKKSVWKVEINTETCSMCEMCVNHCPTEALTINRAVTTEEILFNSTLCDSCAGLKYCQEHCPEKSVTVSLVAAGRTPDAPVVLMTGELSPCADCGNLFVPERKLETLLKQQKITAKSVQSYCPRCRREHLLDAYLEVIGLHPAEQAEPRP